MPQPDKKSVERGVLKTPAGDSDGSFFQGSRSRPLSSKIVLICATIFLIALGVRVLHWQDNRQLFPFAGMTGEYKAHALVLVDGNLDGFLRGPNPPSDANVVKHPPGYPLFMAAIYKLSGNSDTALRSVHIALDALAALLVFFIAAELFPLAVATLAGLLVALSPQLAYHSIMLLPDPLATPPLLVAVYLLIRAVKRPRYATFIAAGVFVAASCWLRSNAMLLPFFFAALVPFLFKRGERLRYAATLLATALILFAPVTIRNYLAFKSFIPLSLSAGITLVEGIGVYDEEGKFGLPSTDYGVTKWEAREYNRPDYLGTRFYPDGVVRERGRIARGLAVVRANPVWFLKVMTHRAFSMLRLARTDIVAAEPAVTHPLNNTDALQPAWMIDPTEMDAEKSAALTATEFARNADASALRFAGDADELLASPPINIKKNTDYLLRLPLKIERGSLIVAVTDASRNDPLSSTPILHPVNWLELEPGQQPSVMVERPFVSGDAEQVRIVLKNGGRRRGGRVVAELGRVELFALGATSHAWTRYPRLLVRGAQKFFLTAWMLPLAVIGAVLMLRARRGRELALLLVIPVYYMSVQSALWTEFRYVLAMYYFLLLLSAVGLHWAGARLWQVARRALTFATNRSSTRASL